MNKHGKIAADTVAVAIKVNNMYQTGSKSTTRDELKNALLEKDYQVYFEGRGYFA